MKHSLTDSSAVCTDGSPGVYYTSELSDPSAPWLIWLDGPTNPIYMSDPTLPATDTWPNILTISYGPFGQNAADFAEYSYSVLMYCSDDLYLGNATVHKGGVILAAWLNEISASLTGAPQLVAGGATVGALGLVSNMGLLQQIVGVDKPISLLLDSPFFTPTIKPSDTINAIVASSPSPVCAQNWTTVVYSDDAYLLVPCCLDYLCASDFLDPNIPVLLLQSLAYATSVNDALLYSSSETAKFSDSQIYNLSLTTTRKGALVSMALRQAANERYGVTSYIGYSCVEAPILSPFGNSQCVQNSFKDVDKKYVTSEELPLSVHMGCSGATQTFSMSMGDFQSTLVNSPSTWSTIRVSSDRSGDSDVDPSIESLVGEWLAGNLVRIEESCQGMNCNPTCVQTRIFLGVQPYEHIGILTGLFVLAVLGLAAAGLMIVYGKPPKPPVEDMHPDAEKKRMENLSALSHAMAAPRCLEARGLTYWNVSSVSSTQAPSLKHISVSIPQGSLVAIIGGSGCGKSTLLELLAGRRAAGAWCGDILLSGKPVTSEWLARNTGIVRQNLSPLVDQLTLLDNLKYAAMLRVRGSEEFIQNRIDFVLNRLELIEFRDSLTSTLSGGQRKRAEVALELLTQPDILFLDEPTSALDARTALNFMDWIAKVSKSTGSSIILSIHQPREEIWNLFTHIILLEKGFLVYSGPPFSFGSESGNPADVAVELAGNRREAMVSACNEWCRTTVSDEPVTEPPSSVKSGSRFASLIPLSGRRSSVSTMSKLTTPANRIRRPRMQLVPSATDEPDHIKSPVGQSSSPTMMCQVRSFLLRLVAVHPPLKLTTLRSVVGLSVLSICVGLLLATIFWSMDSESVRTKALAFLVLVPAFLSNSFVVSYVCEDIPIYQIERSNYYVTPLAFFIHHILHLSIYIVLPFTVFPFIQYFLLWGRVLDTFEYAMFIQIVGFAQICFVAFLSLFVFSCFLLRGNQSNAMIMNSSIESLFALFSGFLAPLPSLSLAPIRWISYLSPAMWGYVGVTYSIANVQFPGNCGGATSSTESTCALSQSGNVLIFALGFDELDPITAWGILVGWSIAFFFLAWLVLARPWDKGPVKLVVAGGTGQEGLAALGQIALVEQKNFKTAISDFGKKNISDSSNESSHATGDLVVVKRVHTPDV